MVKDLVIDAFVRDDLVFHVTWVILGVLGTLFWACFPIVIQNKAKRRCVIYIGIAATCATICTVVFVFAVKQNPPNFVSSWLRDPPDGSAWVVGIFSEDHFGVDHQNGLETALNPHASLIHFEALNDSNLQDMAQLGRRTQTLLKKLKRLLLTKPVVAVVGPSVDNIDREVLRAVSSVTREIPVITESASLRSDMGWGKYEVPTFRISSGVDERADEFGDLVSDAVQAGIKVVLLVERLPDADYSYGEAIYNTIVDRIGTEWTQWVSEQRVTKLAFVRGSVTRVFRDEQGREFPENTRLLQGPNLVLLLGIGLDYLPMMDAYFKGMSSGESKLLGLMNAYASDAKLRTGEYAAARLIELTDIEAKGLNDAADPELADHFVRRFGETSPRLRDQAFSYDAGVIIHDALQASLSSLKRTGELFKPDQEFREAFLLALEETNRRGLSGWIRFESSGSSKGQNIGSGHGKQLRYTVYDSESGEWRSLSRNELLHFGSEEPDSGGTSNTTVPAAQESVGVMAGEVAGSRHARKRMSRDG